jgi:hypothetical protein
MYLVVRIFTGVRSTVCCTVVYDILRNELDFLTYPAHLGRYYTVGMRAWRRNGAHQQLWSVGKRQKRRRKKRGVLDCVCAIRQPSIDPVPTQHRIRASWEINKSSASREEGQIRSGPIARFPATTLGVPARRSGIVTFSLGMFSSGTRGRDRAWR